MRYDLFRNFPSLQPAGYFFQIALGEIAGPGYSSSTEHAVVQETCFEEVDNQADNDISDNDSFVSLEDVLDGVSGVDSSTAFLKNKNKIKRQHLTMCTAG